MLTIEQRRSLGSLLAEFYGSGVYPAGAGADSPGGLLGQAGQYGAVTMPARSFKRPSDSPALAMMDEIEARKALVKILDKAVSSETVGLPGGFVSAAYRTLALITHLKISPMRVMLSGMDKLSFSAVFVDAAAMARRFDVVVAAKGENLVYTLSNVV